MNELIREVNQGLDIRVTPPLELNRAAGNISLRVIDEGFMGVISNVYQEPHPPFSSGQIPDPSDLIVNWYVVQEVYQTKDGEWEILPDGRQIGIDFNNIGVFEWSNQLCAVGSVVEVKQYLVYDWRFFAPGGTVCNQPVYSLDGDIAITHDENSVPLWQNLEHIDIPQAGTWIIGVGGSLGLSVINPTTPVCGTVYLQLFNKTYNTVVANSECNPVTTCDLAGMGTYNSGNCAITTFIEVLDPVTIQLQGYVQTDIPCSSNVPPCTNFSCNYIWGEGIWFWTAMIGPVCGLNAYFPGNCGCIPTGDPSGAYPTLAACMAAAMAAPGCSSSSSSSPSSSSFTSLSSHSSLGSSSSSSLPFVSSL